MTDPMRTTCLIAGGGPAGMMAGYLLARMGLEVTVLEKHRDFLRDFRGDTIHPSTLQLMVELGLIDAFLKRPHDKVTELAGQFGGTRFVMADFSHLPTECKFVAFMPQWHFLDFLSTEARRYRGFRLLMQAEATGLVREGERVQGLEVKTQDGSRRILADLVLGCVGRHSRLREEAGLEVDDLGAPMDVLWMRVSRLESDPSETFGHMEPGRMFVMLNRREYWQCAFVIPKGSAERVRAAGIEAFRAEILNLTPFLGRRVDELKDWDQVKLLTVGVDRLRRWHRPGLLFLGDVAHTMSPVGGVGINLAIQDAVAAVNILGPRLAQGTLTDSHLAQVQKRREWPTRVTQSMQLIVQRRMISRVLAMTAPLAPPLPVRLLGRFPALRRLPARLIGLGVRPEHVRTPEVRR